MDHHVEDLISVDCFTVPTATFRVLFVLLVLSHDRRRIVHFNVTSSPSPEWTAQQIVQAFPKDTAPRYLFRDRDGSCGAFFRPRPRARDLGIEEVLAAPRSPSGDSETRARVDPADFIGSVTGRGPMSVRTESPLASLTSQKAVSRAGDPVTGGTTVVAVEERDHATTGLLVSS